MIKPAGLIQQISREDFHLEYLEKDNEPPVWTRDRSAALIFADYHDADLRAKQMGGRPIFAITLSSSLPWEPAIPAEIEPPARPSKIRKPRHRFAASYHSQLVP